MLSGLLSGVDDLYFDAIVCMYVRTQYALEQLGHRQPHKPAGNAAGLKLRIILPQIKYAPNIHTHTVQLTTPPLNTNTNTSVAPNVLCRVYLRMCVCVCLRVQNIIIPHVPPLLLQYKRETHNIRRKLLSFPST